MKHGSGQFLLACSLALVLAAGCRSPGTASSSTLRIGVTEAAPPLVFRQKGRWCGVEAELGRALAARLHLKPVFIACPPDKLSAALLNGEVDILMAGLAITDERRLQMDFSMPYLVVGQAALVRSADLPFVSTLIKIRSVNARVGVVAGSPGDQYVARYFTQATRQPYPDINQAAEALRAGQTDIVVYDAPAAWWLSLRYAPALAIAPVLFDRAEIAWAFRRGSVSLRESTNRALAEWQKDGTLEAILKRWIPYSK